MTDVTKGTVHSFDGTASFTLGNPHEYARAVRKVLDLKDSRAVDYVRIWFDEEDAICLEESCTMDALRSSHYMTAPSLKDAHAALSRFENNPNKHLFVKTWGDDRLPPFIPYSDGGAQMQMDEGESSGEEESSDEDDCSESGDHLVEYDLDVLVTLEEPDGHRPYLPPLEGIGFTPDCSPRDVSFRREPEEAYSEDESEAFLSGDEDVLNTNVLYDMRDARPCNRCPYVHGGTCPRPQDPPCSPASALSDAPDDVSDDEWEIAGSEASGSDTNATTAWKRRRSEALLSDGTGLDDGGDDFLDEVVHGHADTPRKRQKVRLEVECTDSDDEDGSDVEWEDIFGPPDHNFYVPVTPYPQGGHNMF